jgi:MFS family permease
LWVRRNLHEPEIWSSARSENARTAIWKAAIIFRPPLLRTTILFILLSSLLMFAYWGLFTWIPTYLSTPVSRGGAGMSIVQSLSAIVPMQAGAFLGYLSFGFFADRLGRRPSFLIFVLGAAACVPAYALHTSSSTTRMLLGPLVGFFGHGYFSVFGAMLAELFPSSVRGIAQGLCYNAGRGASVLAPATVGLIADRNGIGVAIACTSVLYVLGAGAIYLLPETKGRDLA